MTLSINTNSAAMAALESLSTTTAALNATENEVSTGKKVSTSSDDPAIYAISQSMSGNIAGLAAVSDGLSLGAQVVNTANTAAQDISSTLQTLQNSVTKAGDTGIDQSTMQTQVANAINEINAYARGSTFNGVNVLTSQADSGAANGSANIVTGLQGNSITIANQMGTSGLTTLSSFLGLTGAGFAAGATASATDQTVLNAAETGVNIKTSSTLAATDFGNGANVVLKNGDGTTTTFEFDTTGTQTTSANTTGATANHVVTVLVDPTNQSTSAMLGNLVNAMNQNGYNAVIQNDGSINVTGQGVASSTAAAADATPGTASAAGSNTGIDGGTQLNASAAAITTVQGAISKMNAISTTLGASSQEITGMQSFTSDLSDALTTGVGGLTDADLSTASAKLTSLQTKQQLAIQSLSIANSQSQSILSLFRG